MNVAMLAGSLVAVLALAWLAHRLRLGGDARIAGDDVARTIAEQHQFDVADVIVDRAGMGALASDAAGGFLLIRRHGAHFVAERLAPPLAARLDQRFLTLGQTVLDLGEAAPVWAARLRSLA
jgi:hypothetical protein